MEDLFDFDREGEIPIEETPIEAIAPEAEQPVQQPDALVPTAEPPAEPTEARAPEPEAPAPATEPAVEQTASSDPVILSASEKSQPQAQAAQAAANPYAPPQQAAYAPPQQAAYARPTVPPTIDSARPAPAYARPYAAQQPQTVQPKKRSLGWVWLIIGLLVGFALGFLAAQLTQSGSRRAAVSQQPAKGDLQEQIQIAGDAAIPTAPSQVYSKNLASVVGIASETQTNAWGQQSAVASVGTGFVITEDGYILTNYHVVEGDGTVTVMLSDGRELPATLVGYDSEICDIALLKVEASGLQPVTFGDSDKLLVGEQVCAIGHPLGELTYTLTVGYVSAKDRLINSDGAPINMMQTDCTINSGNSGGPLFDMNGNVIGITTAKYSGTTTSGASVEGIGFAIPINDVVVLLDDLQTYGYLATQPYLGISVRVGGDNEGGPAGAYVNDTLPGYAAEAAGLKSGDILTRLGDYPIDSYNSLSAALRHYHAGDTVELEVWRDGKTLTMDLSLDARPHTEPEETEAAAEPQQGIPGWGWSFP